MFSLFGLMVLIFFLYLRPQEVIERLRVLPMLNLAAALAALGLAIDLRLGRIRVSAAPVLPFLVGFLALALFGTLVRVGVDGASAAANRLLIPTAVLLLLAHGVASFRGFQTIVATVLAMALCIALVCVHQAQQPFTCFAVKDSYADRELASGKPDGRPCEEPRDCYRGDAEPGAEYMCEKPGWFSTATIGRGRVRFRGLLQDPNEVSMILSVALPFAFGFWQLRRDLIGTAVGLGSLGMVGATVMYSQSRGGQLVFLVVLGAYFIRRFGIGIGAIAAAIGALPVLLLGGRSGVEADSSAMERIETLYVGVEMVRSYPIIGVGISQFPEHHFLTAHNAYLLVTAETGLPGFFLWSCMIYLTVKAPLVIYRRYQKWKGAEVAHTWAMALLASYSGLLLGIFFLSFSYHVMLFIYLGLSGALYNSCKRHDPDLEVGLSLKEAGLVALSGPALIALIGLYARWKGV